jgi:hypothetical protein
MAATIENLRTEEGVTFTKTWTYANTRGVDPADYTGAITLRAYPDAEEATLEVTTTVNDNGSLMTIGGTAASVTIAVTISADDMATLTGKSYAYDVLLTDDSGATVMPYAGEVENRRLISRA